MIVNYRAFNSKTTSNLKLVAVSLESKNEDGKRVILVRDGCTVRRAIFNDEKNQWEVNCNKKTVSC